MIRVLFGEGIFFLLPFVAYACYLIMRQRHPAKWDNWSAHVPKLAIAGVVCVIVALLITGLTVKHETGAYIPAHMENGKIVPGRFE